MIACSAIILLQNEVKVEVVLAFEAFEVAFVELYRQLLGSSKRR